MALLECEHLTKQFGGVVALDDVSFGVERGETVGLIGPNGAGKSTLFKAITGALAPTEGTVRFDGRDITGMSPHAVTSLGLAKTHQIVRPFGNLTIRENVEVAARFGRTDRDADVVVEENLAFVGLEDRADAYPDEQSIGALKRLEIARVLATDPELVLFDEVAGGLDPEETERIVELIEEIADRGKTVFLIDHVMRALMSVSERVFVLNNGAFIAKGTPESIQNDERVIEAYLGERARADDRSDEGTGTATAGGG
jgi:branched-chain amino acid transport system ATP-binding protein